MWLVLCSSSDMPALWAYQGLKACGLAPLELVSAEVLACSLRWAHGLRKAGVSIEITLADGRTITADTTRGVLNRLVSVPSEYLPQANPAERQYATQEFTAFFMSWLYALPQPVLNRPTPQGLSGHWRHISEWVWLASCAGLPTARYIQTSHDENNEMRAAGKLIPPHTQVQTIIVVAGRVVGVPVPSEISEGCRRLAALAGTELLGIEFVAGTAGPWTFVGATPFPDLRLGGQGLLGALKDALKNGSGE